MISFPTRTVSTRGFAKSDEPFLTGTAERLNPGATTSPRDQQDLQSYISNLDGDALLAEPNAEAFVAMIGTEPAGIIAVQPDADYFTNHARAHVDFLVVARETEGQGVGRALISYVERWARERGLAEVVLDAFGGNAGAIAFYERSGFSPDHIRLTKTLV